MCVGAGSVIICIEAVAYTREGHCNANFVCVCIHKDAGVRDIGYLESTTIRVLSLADRNACLL